MTNDDWRRFEAIESRLEALEDQYSTLELHISEHVQANDAHGRTAPAARQVRPKENPR